MKINLKKALSLMLALVFVFSLAACGGEPTSSQGSKASTASTESTPAESSADASSAANANADTSEHVNINMLVLGNKPTNGRMEAAVAAENELLKEKVNATLSLEYIEWTDWQTQYNLRMMSNDSSIDLIVTATDWLYAWPLSKKGAFLALSEDMLQTYAPQTWAEVPAEDWDLCKLGDTIYFIPENQYIQWTNHGMYYRGDWAAEAGMTNGVEKFDDLTTYFKYVKENKEGVIPWDVSGKGNMAGIIGGYIASNSDYTTIIGTDTGNFNLFAYKGDDYKTVVSPYFDDDVFYDAAELMKEWNTIGVWRDDVLNYEGETRELMYAGQSGADQHHVQTYVTQTQHNMELKQPGSDLQMYWWGEENGNYCFDLKTHGAMAVNAFSKNPERALMVYDLIRNDQEIYMLHNYGIEGTDYILTDDGLLDRPEGWDQSKDNLDTNFWAGRMDKFEPDQVQWYKDKDVMYEELAADAKEYQLSGFAFDPEQCPTEIAAVADVCSNFFPLLAYGKTDDPKATVDEFREQLKAAGIENLMANIQQQLDEALAQ